MNKPSLLVVEDNPDTRKFLETVLVREFEVVACENAIRANEVMKNKTFDLIIMDVVLPLLGGIEAMKNLKKDERTKSIPIILLSSKSTAADIVHGLDSGADDYMVKPFDYKELIARIKVRLREKLAWKNEPRTLMTEELKVILDTREVFYFGKSIELTITEFDLLRTFIEQNGKIITRDDIIKEVWKDIKNTTRKRTIDVHIRALRKKIPTLKRNLMSIYGKGYKFES